ncbi:MAG: non-canonical purine NTP pyrophosphatase, partial [Caldilineaceae bacterium]|nr:non-canonical purine NTP pyrophosphatase [Caldilineaceae bacterium]
MQTLLIATHNQGKLREYRALLADLPLKVVNLDEAGVDFDVDETGTTFAENALLKARAYAAATGLLTWADDSGLEV